MCQQKQLITNRTSQILCFLSTVIATFICSDGDGDGGGSGDGGGCGGDRCRRGDGGGGGSTVLNQTAS